MVIIRYAHVQIHPGSNAWLPFIFFCGVAYSDKCSGKQIDIKRNRLWSLLTFHIYTLFKINICYEINPWTNRKKEHRTKLTSANLLSEQNASDFSTKRIALVKMKRNYSFNSFWCRFGLLYSQYINNKITFEISNRKRINYRIMYMYITNFYE